MPPGTPRAAGGHRRRRRLRADGRDRAARCRHRLRAAGARCAARRARTALSSGFIPAAGTRVQRAAGVHDDSAERFAARHPGQGPRHGRAAPGDGLHRGHRAGDGCAAAAPRPAPSSCSTAFSTRATARCACTRCRSAPARRWWRRCEAAAVRAGALQLGDALVRELWCDADQRVLGVGYQRPDGRIEHLACRVLLLACNGFGGNPAMVRELLPEMRDAVFAGHAGNDGSAIAWGRQLGARPGRPGRLPGPRLLGGAAGRADHLGADDGRRRPGQCPRPALPRRDRRLLRSLGAGAGAARRHRLEPVRRAAAGAGPQLPRLRRGRGGRRGAPCRRRAGAGRADRLRCGRAGRHAGRHAAAGTVLRDQGHRRAVPHPGRAGHRRALPRAAAPTARRCPTCWRPAARRAACPATRCGATCRATACSARWPAAGSPRTPRQELLA